MAGILLIIFIAYVYSTSKKIEKLEKEIKELKQNKDKKIEPVVKEVQKDVSVNQVIKEKKKVNPNEQKNTSILITGALLIILSAIVFLTSTWNAIPNLLKTLVIILLVVVFLGASKIAKNKFHLEKTSSTFFYMAMAYIPICLISCSIFGLFGDFLSIYGDGKYIYLTCSSIITSLVYFINYKSNKNKGLFYASFIAQVSSVILFSLIFESSVRLIIINLLLYNIILLLVSRNKEMGQVNFIKNIYQAIPYISAFITIFLLYSKGIQEAVILVLLAINFITLYIKKENIKLNAWFFNTVIYILGMYSVFANSYVLNENLRILLQICYCLVVFVVEQLLLRNTKNEFLQKSSIVISIINMAIIYIESNNELIIKPFIIAIIEGILLLIAFAESKEKGKLILSYLIPSCLILIGCNILNVFDKGYSYYIILAILVFVIGELVKNKNLNKGFFIISHLFIVSAYLVISTIKPAFLDDVIYFIILLAIYSYSFMKNKKLRIFKYLSYITSCLVLYTGANFLELENDAILLIPTITAICISFFENKFEVLKDRYSKIFKTILEFLAYISLASTSNDIRIIFTTLFTVYLSIISLYKKRISIETITSGIYLFACLGNFESFYIREIFCLIWAGTHFYIFKDSKENDIFRGILYICSLILYSTILKEIGLDEYYSFTMIGVTVVAILFTKTIINKYTENTDNLEYILFSLIYLTALGSYSSEKDGMIYVLSLVAILIYSYSKKYGAIFVVTTLGIILNALALTREFWFSIPWWIYLLLIGTILIGFAIKNESNENKEKITIAKVVKKIKDNIEK